MESKLNPFPINALIAILLSLLLIWSSYASPSAARVLSDGVGAWLSYVEVPAEELRALVRLMDSWVNERRTLQERNAELEVENLRLRTALHISSVPAPVSRGDLIGARVTLRYPDAWWKELRIDKGRADGIRVGAPTLSEGYMIGRVARVGEHYAWIELVTSASFMLAAVIEDTWDLGVINGDDMGSIWLMYVPTEKEYERGVIISTALVGDYLPPGIPIGKIWGPGETRDGFTPQMVVSGAHLTQLYNVQVLRTNEYEEASPE